MYHHDWLYLHQSNYRVAGTASSKFGYPHMLVTDNATTFTSQEFQAWCEARGIIHVTRAPYHPATNEVAECLVQIFKKSPRKSNLQLREALQEFLMQS